MSVLQTLREKAGPLVAGVIGLSLLIFIVSDFFDSNSSQRKKAKKYYELASVDGEAISYQDFETKVQDMTEIYKMSGSTNINEEMVENIRNQVWQQFLMDKVYGKTFEKTGLAVTPDEVDAMVLGNNPHQIVRQLFTDPNTGAFNKSYLINFLKATESDEATKKYWLFFEDQIISDKLNTKLVSLISKGIYVTSKQAEFESKLASQTVDFSFTGRNYSSLSDSTIKVSKDEISKYYENHKQSFKRTALRDMEYITFPIVPSEADRQEVKNWAEELKPDFEAATDVEQFVNLNSDTRYIGVYRSINDLPESLKSLASAGDKSYVYGPYFENESYKLARIVNIEERPDSVRVRHILITAQQTGSSEKAREVADSLMNLIKRGVDFETIATANSADQGSAPVGGDLGWFSEGSMVPGFSDPCFKGKKGDLLTAETNYGIHIINILDQAKKVKKFNISIVDRRIIASNITTQRIYAEASKFAGINDTPEKFNKAVTTGKLDKKIAANIVPSQKEITGLTQPRGLLMALYQAEKAGSIILDNNSQAIFELPDMYIVAYCTKIQNEGIAPIADVSSEIKFKLAKEKKADIISTEMSKIAQGKTIYDVASHYGTTVQDAAGINFRSYSVPGAGIEPALIAAASSSKQGLLSKPVAGNNGVYMFVVNTVTPANSDDITVLKERLNSNYQIRASYEAYQALKDKKEVVDSRYRFY